MVPVSVEASSPSKSGVEKINAAVTIDCTGDGDVAARAGVPFENGNEGLHITQPATMFFRIGNVNAEKLYHEIEAHKNDFYRKDGVNYRSLHWRVAEARARGTGHWIVCLSASSKVSSRMNGISTPAESWALIPLTAEALLKVRLRDADK